MLLVSGQGTGIIERHRGLSVSLDTPMQRPMAIFGVPKHLKSLQVQDTLTSIKLSLIKKAPEVCRHPNMSGLVICLLWLEMTR